MRPIPARPHVLVHVAFRQAKEPGDQDPVIAIQDHPSVFPIPPGPWVYPKVPGSTPN